MARRRRGWEGTTKDEDREAQCLGLLLNWQFEICTVYGAGLGSEP